MNLLILFLIDQLPCSHVIKQFYKQCRLHMVNKHPRDDYITFYEEGHKYDLIHPDTHQLINPISVTTLIHKYSTEFNADLIIYRMMKSKNWPSSKYYGLTKEEIKKSWEDNRDEAANLGTMMHADIERYLDGLPPLNDKTTEFQFFKSFWQDFTEKYPKFRVFRVEALVYDEHFRYGQGICGSIDCLLKNDKDQYIILDWKRSKEIKMKGGKMKPPFDDMADVNFSHYTLQLNIYRHILMTKYGYNVIFLMLVILHPNQESYQCLPVPRINLSELWSQL